MINTKNKKGFTLIELLVVIAIIGILATWATATYTSQIQKSRDTVRMTDISALKSWVEQVYWDLQEYPTAINFTTEVIKYMQKFPKDSKNWQPCASYDNNSKTNCWYAYKVDQDTNWVQYQIYELSTWFENKWNVTSKAKTDSWNDSARLESWINTSTINQLLTSTTATVIEKGTTSNTWALTPSLVIPTNATDTIIIFWS